jgi:hypothetical protein
MQAILFSCVYKKNRIESIWLFHIDYMSYNFDINDSLRPRTDGKKHIILFAHYIQGRNIQFYLAEPF